MNKLQLLLYSIFASIVFMSSCGLPYCKKTPFSNADLEWLNAYETGDTILFSNQVMDVIDTMIISYVNILNPPNTSIFDLRGCNWLEDDNEFQAIANYLFEIRHNGKIYDGSFSLTKRCHKIPAIYSLSMLGKSSVDYNNYSAHYNSNRDTIPNSGMLTINDSGLHNLRFYDGILLKELHWNREKGLIGYQIADTLYTIKE